MVGRLAGKRILVVEDEYFIATDLQHALIAEGVDIVGPVSDLAGGLFHVDARLDAAVLDINLEDGTSFGLAEALAARGVPYLFVTGYDDAALPPEHRATPRIIKPFADDAVIEMIVRIAMPGDGA